MIDYISIYKFLIIVCIFLVSKQDIILKIDKLI